MLKIKLIYGDGREELCNFSELPKLGQPLVIDGLTYHILEIARALNNADPDGPAAIVTLSSGTAEAADNRIPSIPPSRGR